MRALISLILLVGALSACPAPNPSCPTLLCPNSPYTTTQLKGYLTQALGQLATFGITNPNPLIPNYNPTTCATSMANGRLDGCGYPTFFAGANQTAGNPTWSGLFDNPDVYYGSVYTGRTCISSLADVSFPRDFSFQLRNDEAIIWLGCTPAAATYFSFNRAVVNKTSTEQVNGLLGESLSELSMKTASNAASPTPFGAAALLIYAADQDVANAITNAFTSAGFPSSAINVDPWPVAELNMASNGQINADTSLLTFVNRIYKFTDPTHALYTQCSAGFPFIRLTPAFPRTTIKPIAKIETWRPDDAGVLYGSEWGFLPVLQGVVQTVSSYTTSALSNPAAGGWSIGGSFTSQPFRVKDFGLKWLLESRFGAFGTKDCAYSTFPLQLSQAYAHTQNALSFSMVCGIDHTKSFTTNVPQLSHIPVATYFNYALYGVNPVSSGSAVGADTGLAAGLTSFTPLNIAAFPAPIQAAFNTQVFAKVGVAAASNFYCNYFSSDCTTVHAILGAIPCTSVNTTIPNGASTLAHLHRAYLNPFTKTGPSELTLLPPFLTTFSMVKSS